MSNTETSPDSPSSETTTTLSYHIPQIYILWTRYLEPLSALGAIIAALLSPAQFVSVFLPSTVPPSTFGVHPEPSIFSSASTPLTPLAHLLLFQTLSLYALFVVIEFALLHWTFTTSTLNAVPQARYRIFALVQWANFASDIFYVAANVWTYGSADAGPAAWRLFCDPRLWKRNEWLNLGGTWIPLLLRVGFLAGLGVRAPKTKTE